METTKKKPTPKRIAIAFIELLMGGLDLLQIFANVLIRALSAILIITFSIQILRFEFSQFLIFLVMIWVIHPVTTKLTTYVRKTLRRHGSTN